MNSDNVTYFDSFRVEYIQREVKKIIGNRNILKIKSLTDYTNSFSPNKYEKNNKIILECFQ